jgi:hypothetical protein
MSGWSDRGGGRVAPIQDCFRRKHRRLPKKIRTIFSFVKAFPKGRRAAAVALSAGSGLQRSRQQGSKHRRSPAIPSKVFSRYISLIWG